MHYDACIPCSIGHKAGQTLMINNEGIAEVYQVHYWNLCISCIVTKTALFTHICYVNIFVSESEPKTRNTLEQTRQK